jgi:flagellar basal-body rod protein FlgB
MSDTITQFIFNRAGVPKYNDFLDLSSLRHKLVAGNVANATTAGYQSKQMDFHAEVRRAFGDETMIAGTLTHEGHLPLGNHPERPPKISNEKIRGGEFNSVDIDSEISNMAQNELTFSVGAKLLALRLEGLQKAIKGQ